MDASGDPTTGHGDLPNPDVAADGSHDGGDVQGDFPDGPCLDWSDIPKAEAVWSNLADGSGRRFELSRDGTGLATIADSEVNGGDTILRILSAETGDELRAEAVAKPSQYQGPSVEVFATDDDRFLAMLGRTQSARIVGFDSNMGITSSVNLDDFPSVGLDDQWNEIVELAPAQDQQFRVLGTSQGSVDDNYSYRRWGATYAEGIGTPLDAWASEATEVGASFASRGFGESWVLTSFEQELFAVDWEGSDLWASSAFPNDPQAPRVRVQSQGAFTSDLVLWTAGRKRPGELYNPMIGLYNFGEDEWETLAEFEVCDSYRDDHAVVLSQGRVAMAFFASVGSVDQAEVQFILVDADSGTVLGHVQHTTDRAYTRTRFVETEEGIDAILMTAEYADFDQPDKTYEVARLHLFDN